MKKFILISAFLGLTATCGYGQTYYYQCVARVDKDGVRSPCSSGMYVAFINNKGKCYESDKNGYQPYCDCNCTWPMTCTSCSCTYATYSFVQTLNGTTHVYYGKSSRTYSTGYGMFATSSTSYSDKYYYFSSDFNQLRDAGSSTDGSYWEYKRTSGPEEKKKQDDSKIPVF
jgi:hypothetical protein